MCGDFAFYQFPTEDFWRKPVPRTPPGFRFAFKVPEQITCKVFPTHPRYGPQAGKSNETFLNAGMLERNVPAAAAPYRDKHRR